MTPNVWGACGIARAAINTPSSPHVIAGPCAGHARLSINTPSVESTEVTNMASELKFDDPRLATLDGFRVEIDEPRERADVILDRPPLNVISMPQRDQLRLVFESLDDNSRIRIIVLRAVGEHFSSGGNIKGFLDARPETVSKLAWNIAAPAQIGRAHV